MVGEIVIEEDPDEVNICVLQLKSRHWAHLYHVSNFRSHQRTLKTYPGRLFSPLLERGVYIAPIRSLYIFRTQCILGRYELHADIGLVRRKPANVIPA